MYQLITEEMNCVLVWDVRGEAQGTNARDALIMREVTTLNLILNHANLERHFLLLHLKINVRFMAYYELPRYGRFFLQPFTLLRDVFEARYVVHLRGPGTKEFFVPSEDMKNAIISEMEQTRSDLVSGKINDRHLVCNMLCCRLRRINYIETEAYNSSSEEICLFTINHNSPSEVLRYLSFLKERGISYIISFFSGAAIGADPHEFPEGAVIARSLGTILDTRSFIRAKLDGIYLVLSEAMLTLMNEETFTSETYRIRRTEYSVANRSRTPAYDTSRMDACAERNLTFPKFPNTFSISENLASPSGHALRMAIEYIDGSASIAMLAQKIVKNACEINGLSILGKGISSEGVVEGEYPEVMTSNYSYDVLTHVTRLEEGQRKLATIFHSIAIAHTTIVYVGSAPGTGWLSALEYYPNVKKVIFIDPRPLDDHHDSRVVHHLESIDDPDKLYGSTD